MLAATGAGVYLIVGGDAGRSGGALPTKVLATQAISLVESGPPGRAGASPALATLVALRSGLVFTSAAQDGANWTADQMVGGTYIFIYLPNDLCLASPGVASPSAVALQKCDLEASQRWDRLDQTVGASGLDYWQLRNSADDRCLTVANAIAAAVPAESGVRLERCGASATWRQLISFLAPS